TSELAPLTADASAGPQHIDGTVAALDQANLTDFAPAIGPGSDGGHVSLGLLVNYIATFVGGSDRHGWNPTAEPNTPTTTETPTLSIGSGWGAHGVNRLG